MNPDTILALRPGPELDQAVHTFVMGGAEPIPQYSTDDGAGAKILDRLNLFVGRINSGPKYAPAKPWIAGILAYEPSISGYSTRLSVTASTRLAALCKAALLLVFQPAKADRPAPRQTSEQAARDLAARIGTPGARNPAAGVAAAEKLAEDRQRSRELKQEKEARRAAKLLGKTLPKGKAGAAPESEPLPPTRPARPGPTIPQPATFTTAAASRRLPIPTRPKAFIPPQPIDTGGNEQR